MPMSSLNSDGEVAIAGGPIISCVGKKGSGKTVVAMMFIRSFPGDVVVIDVAGDDGPQGDGVVTWRGAVDELPRRFPEHLRQGRERLILRYCPDAGSKTFREDMDAVVGIALQHSTREKPAMLVVHEIGVVARVHQVRPHMQRFLQHNRHAGCVGVFTGPRVHNTDPAVWGQSDLIYIFELKVPADRRELAGHIGWDPASLDAGVHNLAQYEYLRYDGKEPPPAPGQPDTRLKHFPALPADAVRDVLRWSKSVPAPTPR
jgi:hypothetical protein